MKVSLNYQSKVLDSLFLLYSKLRVRYWPLAFISYKTIFVKKVWNQYPCLIFYLIFKVKYYSIKVTLRDCSYEENNSSEIPPYELKVSPPNRDLACS